MFANEDEEAADPKINDNPKRKFYEAKKRNNDSLPQHVILLNIANKGYENKIANMFKDYGWHIYDHLYPFRQAAKCISHDQQNRDQFINFLATQTCDIFHHPKDEFVMYSFFKWCRNLKTSSECVIILGIHSPKEISKLKSSGTLIVSDQTGADFLILDLDDHRIHEISTLVQQTPDFHLIPQLQSKYHSIQCKKT